MKRKGTPFTRPAPLSREDTLLALYLLGESIDGAPRDIANAIDRGETLLALPGADALPWPLQRVANLLTNGSQERLQKALGK